MHPKRLKIHNLPQATLHLPDLSDRRWRSPKIYSELFVVNYLEFGTIDIGVEDRTRMPADSLMVPLAQSTRYEPKGGSYAQFGLR
jgi:hypothetical protein